MIDPFSKKLTNLIQINRFLKVCQPSKEPIMKCLSETFPKSVLQVFLCNNNVQKIWKKRRGQDSIQLYFVSCSVVYLAVPMFLMNFHFIKKESEIWHSQ